MSQQTLSQPRVHHFYVVIAKYVFHHPEHGIVSVKDPIRLRVAEEYGLSPLILYGMTVAALYRDIVATCARACREPVENIREMTKFVKRYEEHWINAAWLPEL